MRIGPSHQAGSDSLLTAATFFKMREIYFGDHVDDSEYNGKLYGLGKTVLAALTNSTSNGPLDASGSLGMGISGLSMGLGLRSGVTIAERERTPLPRDNTQTQGQQQTGQQSMSLGPGMISSGPAPLSTPGPGMNSFPALTAPYGAMPGVSVNGPYLRQMGVGAER